MLVLAMTCRRTHTSTRSDTCTMALLIEGGTELERRAVAQAASAALRRQGFARPSRRLRAVRGDREAPWVELRAAR